MADRDRRVLVVDDNPAFVDNLGDILGAAGYDVIGAGSCAEARAHAGDQSVAIVDLRLPDGNGIELALALRAANADCEVLLLTGDASTESAAQAVRAGAFAYLVKPISPPDLLLTIEQARAKVVLAAERSELVRRTARAEKLAAIGTLAAGLSHEIRNPLNAAALQLTVLQRRLARVADLPPATLEPLSLVQHEIGRLTKFLDEFLQFAHPRELVLGAVDGARLVGKVLDLLLPQATERGVTIDRELGEAVALHADESRLQQMTMNLVLNAIEASPGGRVRVALGSAAATVVLTIEDAGPGVPTELREKIFEPFFTTKPSGTGLGLPLVHAIVQQHGGEIRLEDSAEGGARFVVSLPVSGAAAAGVAAR